MDTAQLSATLTEALRRRVGSDTHIVDLEAVSAGASAQTWRFDLVSGQQTQRLILQLAAGERRFGGALSKTHQAIVQRIAAQGGVPTPRVCWILGPEDELGEGFIAVRVDGETLGKRIVNAPELAAARRVMTAQCAEILAKIHRLDVSQSLTLERNSPSQLIERLANEHRSYGQPLPVFALAIRWLEHHVPSPTAAVLVHGDFRTGNFIVGPAGIVAVLDWELAHLGAAMEDLGWLCVNAWRFGQLDKAVGGFGTREELFRRYEEACGRPVDRAAVHFWEVYGTLKWGVVCEYLEFQHLRGEVRSIERAAIGRRVAEIEFDLLELIEHGGLT